MSEPKPLKLDELKILYQEIVEGSSPVLEKGYFIRHMTDLDQIELIRKRTEVLQKYVREGVPSEEERLAELFSSGEWSKDKDEEIDSLKYRIKDNEKILPTVIVHQQAGIKKMIEIDRKRLSELVFQRTALLGHTANAIAHKDSVNYMAYMTAFKDRRCKQPLFESWADFESLEEEEIEAYLDDADVVLTRFTEENVRKISVLPFFLNTFSYSKDSIQTFLGVPISMLTNYQLNLFHLGARNLNILSQTEGEPPELLGDTKVDDICLWYDQQYSVILGKRNAANSKPQN